MTHQTLFFVYRLLLCHAVCSLCNSRKSRKPHRCFPRLSIWVQTWRMLDICLELRDIDSTYPEEGIFYWHTLLCLAFYLLLVFILLRFPCRGHLGKFALEVEQEASLAAGKVAVVGFTDDGF